MPKKKRVVLTDKELFEDDVWLASREKRDDDDEDFPEGYASHDGRARSPNGRIEWRPAWRDEFAREFEASKPAKPKTPKSWVWRVWQVRGVRARRGSSDYYDDDALQGAMPKKM